VVDEARNEIKSRYRQIGVERAVEGEGIGRRIIVPTKEIPSGKSIMQAENALTQEQGVPVRLIFLNPEEVTKSHLMWQIVVTPKESKTSEVGKLMFRAFMQDVIPLQPNISYLQERMASVWEENPQKLFAPNPMEAQPMGAGGQPQGQGGTLSPRAQLPTAEKAMGRNIRTTMGANV
jgi:hypothetical protein